LTSHNKNDCDNNLLLIYSDRKIYLLSRQKREINYKLLFCINCDAILKLKDLGLAEVLVDDCGDEEAAAEGAILAQWSYDSLKAKKESLRKLEIKPLSSNSSLECWTSGLKKATGQNFARTLMETPANYMTPQDFAKVF
jgi:leucyl aminopeptidase